MSSETKWTPRETSQKPRRTLLIAGAGIPGLTLAVALKQAHGNALDVIVCDPALRDGAGRHGGRAYAVATAGRRLLARLKIWPEIEGSAEPIREMTISDSRLADPVRPVFLTFAEGSEAALDQPFAHMVEAEPLVDALLTAARAHDVELVTAGVKQADPAATHIAVTLDDGRAIAASLVVAADGARSRLREAAGIGWVGWSYPQAGIVATVAHERPHGGVAIEHFLPSGPFAILPLVEGGTLGHRSSIVWTERAANVAALLGGSPEETLAEVGRRFGDRFGKIALEREPRAYPLALGMARRFRGERLALLGDAAHVIHPIAGQGLNLGLADVAALAEAVTDALRLGMDPGSRDVLAAYERSRRFDSFAMAAATDGLNRLFSNDAMPARLMRDLGLGLVDRLPGLKRRFIGAAAGRGRDLPRLLRGEAL